MGDRNATSWMPRQGRHSVTIGPSLQRTLKARKNEPPPNSKHERHYYTFRYGFRPGSVDLTKPSIGSVKTVPVKNASGKNDGLHKKTEKEVEIRRGSLIKDDEIHMFKGHETPSKEYDCVLIYDEESKMFTLEKLDSTVRLDYDGKNSKTQPQNGSPLPSSIPSTSASSPDGAPLAHSIPKKSKPRTAAEQLEAELEGELMQESTRSPPPKAPAVEHAKRPPQKRSPRDSMFMNRQPPPKAEAPPPPRKEEEEESEGEIPEYPPGRPSTLPPASSAASPSLPPAPPTSRMTLAEFKAGRAKPPTSTPKPPTPPTHPLPPKPAVAAASQKPQSSTQSPKPAAAIPPLKPSGALATQKLPNATPPSKAGAASSQKPTPVAASAKPATKVSRPAGRKREPPEGSAVQPPPPKRVRPSPPAPARPPPPPKKKDVELAFPGGSDFTLPSSTAPSNKPPSSKPPSLALPGSSSIAVALPSAISAPAPAPAPAATADDSDEEEWDDVLTTTQPGAVPATAPVAVPPPIVPRTITMEEIVPEPTVRREEPKEEEEGDEEEIDPEMFAQELNQTLGEDEELPEEEDFLSIAISPVVENQPMPTEDRRPMSMNQFAGGFDDNENMWGDDDDTSSSDDSDDD